MSGECDKCGEHGLDCKCSWFGKEVYLTGPIICKICEKEPIDCECRHVHNEDKKRTNFPQCSQYNQKGEI